MKRAQRLKDMSNRAEKRALVNGNGELKSIINNESNNLHNLKKGTKAPNRQKKTDRTTRLLITILLLFLATESPQVWIKCFNL